MREPTQIVVMGVAGSGKSTVARALAERLGSAFADADAFHSPANIAKMARGVPLDDADRAPWLAALAAWLAEQAHGGRSAVLACSALKRRYRDELRRTAGDLLFVHLVAGGEVLYERLAQRTHFMRPALLESQLADLEPLGADERGITLDATASVGDIVATASRLVAKQEEPE